MSVPRPLRLTAALSWGFLPQPWAQTGGSGLTLEVDTDMVRFDAPPARLFLGRRRDLNARFRAGMDRTVDLLDLGSAEREIERLALLCAFGGVSLGLEAASRSIAFPFLKGGVRVRSGGGGIGAALALKGSRPGKHRPGKKRVPGRSRGNRVSQGAAVGAARRRFPRAVADG